jgi:serine/threonine protein kinase
MYTVDILKQSNSNIGNDVYLLTSEGDKEAIAGYAKTAQNKSVGFTHFICAQNHVIFCRYENNTFPEFKKAEDFFRNIENTFKLKLDNLQEAMATRYQENLYVTINTSTKEQFDILKEEFAKGDKDTDEDILRFAPKGAFILRDSATCVGAKVLAFKTASGKGNVVRIRFVVNERGEICSLQTPNFLSCSAAELAKIDYQAKPQISSIAQGGPDLERSLSLHSILNQSPTPEEINNAILNAFPADFDNIIQLPLSSSRESLSLTEDAAITPIESVDNINLSDEEIAVIRLPSLPKKVDINDLNPTNGKLLSEQEIAQAKSLLQAAIRTNETPRLRARDHRYAVVSLIDTKTNKRRYYAIYKGEKHDKHLGSGSFGKVKLMQDLDTGEWCAVKLQNLNNIPLKMVAQEAENLKALDQAKGFMQREEYVDKPHADILKNQSITGMEFINGMDLFDLIEQPLNNNANATTEKPAIVTAYWLDIGYKAIKAIQNLHNTKHLHRDIKIENLMYERTTGEVKVVDVGMAVQTDDMVYFDTPRGTPRMIAPEIFFKQYGGRTKFDEKTEVFALGATLADLYGFGVESKRVDKEDPELIYPVKFYDSEGMPCRIRLADNKVRKNVLAFLNKMIAANPNKRPTVQEAINYFEQLQKGLLATPQKVRNVGVLDIAEYEGASPAEQGELVEMLKTKDEVWLLDNNQLSTQQLLPLRLNLEAQGINVADRLLQAKTATVPITDLIVKAYDVADKVQDNIYYVSHVTHNPLQIAAEKFGPEEVMKRHFLQKITSNLENELARLQDKYADKRKLGTKNSVINERKTAIENLIKEFKENLNYKAPNYNIVIAKLDALQKQMLSTNTLTYQISKKLAEDMSVAFAKGAKNIEKIKTEAEKEHTEILKQQKK